jgi:mRNA interferase MazF
VNARAPEPGEVWLTDFGQTEGREQSGLRPALIVSPGRFNQGPLVFAVPFTRTERGSPLHVRVEPPEGGLRAASFAMCDQLRALSRKRLTEPWGRIEQPSLKRVAFRLTLLMPDP